MPYLKPNHQNNLRGVKISTIHHTTRGLFFIGPLLSAKGDATRAAKKAYEEYKESKNRMEELQSLKERSDTESAELASIKEGISWEREKELLIAWMVASLRQQYHLAWENKETTPKPVGEDAEAWETLWREVFAEYFTEDDLERFDFCMQMGKDYSKAEMIDFAKENKELLREKK